MAEDVSYEVGTLQALDVLSLPPPRSQNHWRRILSFAADVWDLREQHQAEG
jgi:hypothetical protein